MADTYVEFSQVLSHLSTDEVSWLQNQLDIVYVLDGKEGADPADATWTGCRAFRDMEDPDLEFDEDVGFDYSFSDEVHKEWGRYLWIHSEQNGSMDRVAYLVQKFLRKFRPDQSWSLTYAITCSKPRVGELDGGAVFVTGSDIKHFDTWQFANEEAAAFKDGKDETISANEQAIGEIVAALYADQDSGELTGENTIAERSCADFTQAVSAILDDYGHTPQLPS
jgi:hypothetical protein